MVKAVLAGEISKFVCGIGLDPYFGFIHKSHTGFQPLVYDIIEQVENKTCQEKFGTYA